MDNKTCFLEAVEIIKYNCFFEIGPGGDSRIKVRGILVEKLSFRKGDHVGVVEA